VQPSEYLASAVSAATFIKEKLYDPDTRTLKRSFREGPSAATGFVDDYAFLINALLDLHEAGAGVKWLEWALDLQRTQVSCFVTRLIHAFHVKKQLYLHKKFNGFSGCWTCSGTQVSPLVERLLL
jgi:uncharacterized protein YyaL (SSP411 family)